MELGNIPMFQFVVDQTNDPRRIQELIDDVVDDDFGFLIYYFQDFTKDGIPLLYFGCILDNFTLDVDIPNDKPFWTFWTCKDVHVIFK